jgi:hypothetical protein
MLRNTHVEMLPLETKQSGGKLLPHSDLQGEVFLEDVPRSRNGEFLDYLQFTVSFSRRTLLLGVSK